MTRARAATAVLAVATALAVPARADVSFELLRPPSWSGVPADADPGRPGSMLYPAPTPLAGLIGVLVHGALVGGAQSAEQRRRQQEADAVLDPQRPALAAWEPGDVARQVSQRLTESEPRAPGWRIEASPAFALHRDRRRLDLTMTARSTPASPIAAVAVGAPVETVVVVVDDPRERPLADDGDDDARALKDRALALLAHAGSVAILAASLPAPALERLPARTHRFPAGSGEAMERGRLVARGCGRALLLNLRGHWMSVPAPSAPGADAPATCPPGTLRWQMEEGQAGVASPS